MTPILKTVSRAARRVASVHRALYQVKEKCACLPDGTSRFGESGRRLCFFQMIFLSQMAAIVTDASFKRVNTPRLAQTLHGKNSPNHFSYMRNIFLYKS